MTLRRQVSLGLLFFRVNFIIAQEKLKFKTFFVRIEYSNDSLIVYSYARTSRMVNLAALRAGKMLAIADSARTSPSQIA